MQSNKNLINTCNLYKPGVRIPAKIKQLISHLEKLKKITNTNKH